MQGNTATQYVLLNAPLVRNVMRTQAGVTRWAQLQADRNTHNNEREIRRFLLHVSDWETDDLEGESLVAVMTACTRCLPRVGQRRRSAQLWQKEEGNPSMQFTCPNQGQLLRKWPNSWTPAFRRHQSENHAWEILREGGHLENGLMSWLWSRTPSQTCDFTAESIKELT